MQPLWYDKKLKFKAVGQEDIIADFKRYSGGANMKDDVLDAIEMACGHLYAPRPTMLSNDYNTQKFYHDIERGKLKAVKKFHYGKLKVV